MNGSSTGFLERSCLVSSILALSMTLSSGLAVAQEAEGPPNTFVEGQPIYADEVNENFENLHDRLLALEASILGSGSGGDQTPCIDGCDPVTGLPGPVASAGGYGVPYFKEGKLVGLSSSDPVFAGFNISYQLVDAAGIVLKYLSSGSLKLEDQRFEIADFDIGPNQVESAQPGKSLTLNFSVSELGYPSWIVQNKLREPLGNDGDGTWFYESNDCSGDSFAQIDFTSRPIFLFKGSVHRNPFEGEANLREPFLALSATGYSPASYDQTNISVSACSEIEYQTGYTMEPVPYPNGQSVADSITPPLKLVPFQ